MLNQASDVPKPLTMFPMVAWKLFQSVSSIGLLRMNDRALRFNEFSHLR